MDFQDLAGNDIAFRIRESLGMLNSLNRNQNDRYDATIADMLAQKGRLGQKSGAGWYNYENQKKLGDSKFIL